MSMAALGFIGKRMEELKIPYIYLYPCFWIDVIYCF